MGCLCEWCALAVALLLGASCAADGGGQGSVGRLFQGDSHGDNLQMRLDRPPVLISSLTPEGLSCQGAFRLQTLKRLLPTARCPRPKRAARGNGWERHLRTPPWPTCSDFAAVGNSFPRCLGGFSASLVNAVGYSSVSGGLPAEERSGVRHGPGRSCSFCTGPKDFADSEGGDAYASPVTHPPVTPPIRGSSPR